MKNNASSPLKNAILAFFNLAKCGAKPRTARKITTCVAILSSHACDGATCRINRQAASLAAVLLAATLSGCAMCQSPWDYCNATIGPDGCPNCDFGARSGSAFAPMGATPVTTARGPTPAAGRKQPAGSTRPTEPETTTGDRLDADGESSPSGF